MYTWCQANAPDQMHQTRCIRWTRPDASTASLLLVTIRPCTNCNSGIATSQDCVGKTKRKPKSPCSTPTNAGTSQDCVGKICNKKTMLQMHWHRCWRLQLESTLEISSLLANSAHSPPYHIISFQILSYYIMFTNSFWRIYACVQ